MPTTSTGSTTSTATADGGTATEEPAGGLDPETEAVIAELDDIDVNETPPVELMAKVQEWQEQLGEE